MKVGTMIILKKCIKMLHPPYFNSKPDFSLRLKLTPVGRMFDIKLSLRRNRKT